MTLEDHLGDIIRKARKAAGVSRDTAAQAAGLSPGELENLESSGQFAKRPDLSAMAALVGLDGEKLEQIANGWLPAAKDLNQWRELRVISTTRGGNAVNCYVVWDEVSREAALFDTGWEAAPVFDLVAENQLQLKHLFLTHTHEDHVAAMGAIRERFPKVLLHTSSRSAPPQHRNRPNDFIHLGSLRITNRDTPGHAEDGVIYIVGTWPEDAPHVAIIGDTLFAGSLATGFVSTEQLKQNVREKIFTLPAETLLCPGHGPLTTVAEEKAHNPFF
jgi:glyoxylase-like metal-dependent hydrolase (beta-lactamase superfamily II)/DNA-binding XRE family transcriptional regulator